MPSYIELDKQALFPSSSNAGKVIFGVDNSGQATITDSAGQTTPVGGGGSINTGSFATTGSNTFTGNQTISGSIDFGGGSQIQSVSQSSGDGYGYTTLELNPDVNLGSDQYIVLDPTSPNHIHIRAGGIIDSSSAYLYLGGEKSNVVVRNLDNSFNEKYWVEINSQTGSTQNTWIFDEDGKLSMPGALEHGTSVVATGSYSHAEGNITQAIGDFSHAEGDNTQAIGNYSHAEGYETKTGVQTAYSASISNGIVTLPSSYGDVAGDFVADNILYLYDEEFDKAYSWGTWAISQSYFDSTNTIVELYDTSVTTTTAYVGDINFGISNWTGNQTIPGNYSHAEGYQNLAIGNYSHAEGYQSLAIGYYSHAEGQTTQAIGFASHAEGANTLSIGDYSHAEGDSTVSSGLLSHAEGYATLSSGSHSHAEGQTTTSSGFASHAEGSNTQAIGDYSHAEGYATQAIGDYSHAEGEGTIASASYQHVQGKYNATSSIEGAFIVGNGTDDENRSNLIHAGDSTIEISGSVNISGSLTVNGSDLRPYKVYTALLTQNGSGSLQTIDSGSLTIGVTYYITDRGTVSWDFTNVGALTNNVETYFVATGTTPNSWGNANLVYDTGAPVVTVLENTIGNIWFTYADTGAYNLNSDGLFEYNKTFCSISTTSDSMDPLTTFTIPVVGSNVIEIDSDTDANKTNGLLNRTPIEIRVYN